MRVKPIPEPPTDLDGVREARRAVPLVPGSEADCCALLTDRLDLRSRDVARTWLTFLRGLGLVRETEAGFVRTRVDVDRTAVADGLLAGVLPARELLDALDAEPRSVEEAFEAIEEAVPQWERAKDRNWRETWRTRVARLLDWLVLAGLADRGEGGYVRARFEGGARTGARSR